MVTAPEWNFSELTPVPPVGLPGRLKSSVTPR
jgi:hypothetical protein